MAISVMSQTLLFAAFVCCCIYPTSASLRHNGQRGRGIPGWAGPRWTGTSMDNAILSYNPWAAKPRVRVVADLDPTAPLDRVDISSQSSPTGRLGASPGMETDWVPPYKDVSGFPGEKGRPKERDAITVPVGERYVVSKPDRLRPSYGSITLDPSNNYPLVAPADRIMSGKSPVAEEDMLPKRVAKYLHQSFDHERARIVQKAIGEEFAKTDQDKDGSISHEEYTDEIQNRQNKSQLEAEKMWGKYHTSSSEDMNSQEFARLAHTGYDIGGVNRNNISSVLTLEGGVDMGFWGSGAACPNGTYVTGGRIKMMPLSATSDNTGLNGIGLKCSDSSTVSSVQGPDGQWTPWSECPAGQKAYGFRARTQAFELGQDNSAVDGLELACRTVDLTASTPLSFSVPQQKTPNGAAVVQGGWSSLFTCSASSAICAVQARLKYAKGQSDNLGITDARFYCCAMHIDCTALCGGTSYKNPNPACETCKYSTGLSGR